MKSDRNTAIIVGVLFIIATAFLFIGEAFYRPILDSTDYLDLTYPNRSVVIIGILLEFICVLAIPLIPVFLFPVLKKHNEALALAYVVFRAIEAVILIGVAEINKLSLIGISQKYLAQGGGDDSYYHSIGNAIKAATDWGDTAGLLYNMVFVVGALILYSVLYKSRLIPRVLSVWGIIAAVGLMIGALLSTFTDISPAMVLLIIIPIGVQEMIMAVWLITKGFTPSSIALESA